MIDAAVCDSNKESTDNQLKIIFMVQQVCDFTLKRVAVSVLYGISDYFRSRLAAHSVTGRKLQGESFGAAFFPEKESRM